MGRKPRDLERLYDEAERNGTCVVGFSQSERQLLLRHAERDGLECPLPGLFVRRSTWDAITPNERALWAMRGIAALHPTWTFCSTSAALALGLRMSYSASRRLHVMLPFHKGKIDAMALPDSIRSVHPLTLDFEFVHPPLFKMMDTQKADGLLITSPLDSVFESLCDLDFSDGLVVADSFLSTYGISQDQLREGIEGCRLSRAGSEQARAAARYADARAESGGESFARGRMIVNGYEVPDLQVPFVDPLDGHGMRADFVWRDTPSGLVIGEFDGFEKYVNPDMTKGESVERLLVRQNRRDTHLNLCCDAIFHFGPEDTKSDYRLRNILDSYRIPRRKAK